MASLLLGSELALASSLLFKQCLVLSLKLGVDGRTPFGADLPLQLVWAAERVTEAPAGLPMSGPVRCESESL